MFRSESAAARPRPERDWWGTGIVLGALWLILINQLRVDWEINPQYHYGWLVPLLTAYLCWSRWPSRPEPAELRRPWPLALLAALLAAAFFPTRLVREAAPDWSVVSWALALEILALTLAAIAWMGGWRSLRHLAWPVAFFLVGVAWPVRFETALTQGLMQRLAALTAELVGWAGVAAVAHGNLIQLRVGALGVDEACSGVRSLQSMLMASLFLGELHRFKPLARFGLIAAGLVIALCFNLLRALILVTLAIREGLDAIGKWHDPAGFSILAASFGALCLVVKIFAPKSPPAEEPAPRHAWRPLPARIWIPALALLAIAELGTEAWYRSHETASAERLGWSVRWPETRPQFAEREISPSVRTMLAYNEGREVGWTEPDGSRWLMFAFKWYSARTSTISARQHRPEVCLPAGGRTLLAELPPIIVEVGDLRLPFRVYDFDNQGQPLHVFFCLWEVANRDAGQHLRQEFSREARLQRVFAGQRNLGQQSLEVIIFGMSSRAEAEAAFRARMQECLVPVRS